MSDNFLKGYIQARQQEELALMTSLSNKRRRLINEEDGNEESERKTDSHMGSNLDIIELLAAKCKSLYTRYSSLQNMEKHICYLVYNSIVYLSKDTKIFTKVEDELLEKLKESNGCEKTNLEFDKEIIEKLKGHSMLRMTLQNKYYDSLKLIPLATPGLENQSFRIYSRWLEEFVYRQNMLSSWRNMSEEDIVARYYEPVFSTLFEGSRLVLKLGKTENNFLNTRETPHFYFTSSSCHRGKLLIFILHPQAVTERTREGTKKMGFQTTKYLN